MASLPAQLLETRLPLPLKLSVTDWRRPLGARLKHFASQGEEITEDLWVIQAIQGVQLELLEPPVQIQPQRERKMTATQATALSEEVACLIEKGAVREILATEPSFLSPMFVSDGRLRPVIDLRQLNKFLVVLHFKMEGVSSLRDLIQKGDFFWKVDLKDVYLTVLMSSASQTLLGFQWDGRRFQFRALPFGLSSAPWIFTKILHPVIAVLRQWGHRLVVYLDDILGDRSFSWRGHPSDCSLDTTSVLPGLHREHRQVGAPAHERDRISRFPRLLSQPVSLLGDEER